MAHLHVLQKCNMVLAGHHRLVDRQIFTWLINENKALANIFQQPIDSVEPVFFAEFDAFSFRLDGRDEVKVGVDFTEAVAGEATRHKLARMFSVPNSV